MLSGIEVCDDSFAQGADRADVGVALLVHLTGLGPDGDHLASTVVEGYY